mmetsp:Transcript_42196/g.62056  ORF Transcript_42196/g.62056 Transcript_42196/m.62056 type:complete len:155 (+) Transcript_42196:1802-2266(+)
MNRSSGNQQLPMVEQLLPFNQKPGKVFAVSMKIPNVASPGIILQNCNDLKGLEKKERKSPDMMVAANKHQERATSFGSPRPLVPKSSLGNDDVNSLVRKCRSPLGEVVVSAGTSGGSFVFSQIATNSKKNVSRQEQMLATRRKTAQRFHRTVTS